MHVRKDSVIERSSNTQFPGVSPSLEYEHCRLSFTVFSAGAIDFLRKRCVCGAVPLRRVFVRLFVPLNLSGMSPNIQPYVHPPPSLPGR